MPQGHVPILSNMKQVYPIVLSFLTSTFSLCLHAVGTFEIRAPGYGWNSAEYTTSHVYIDEVAGNAAAIEMRFTPGIANVTDVEVYTNINRRALARTDKNADNVPDGIHPVDGSVTTDSQADTDPLTGHYFIPHNMSDGDGNGTWELTLNASQTGAYRITARFKVSTAIAENGNNTNNWIWYGLRDHALVVSPVDARDLRIYEINVFNIEASGDTFAQRSTFEDLHNAAGAPHNATNRWDLDYLTNLGCNTLWFQPIHPIGIDGREPSDGWGGSGPAYEPGSPYAVKNFFEINPLMSINYDVNKTTYNSQPIDPRMHPDNRAAAMTAFQNFAAAADTAGVHLMLDAAFNHTGYDVELAQIGVDLFQPDGQTWSPLDEIRNREARFFSRDYNSSVTGYYDGSGPTCVDGGENYGDRAVSASGIAPAPDRFDFGKWNDVVDVYFGRYDSLVEYNDCAGSEYTSYQNEGDWFDFSDPEWTSGDFTQGGVSYNVTQRVWDYFAEYALHWLEKTRPAGQNRNSSTEGGLSLEQRYEWDARGIDGLRCDFGQGLPPRCWEYIINVARDKKWNFIMMSESLDGGSVTYRSNRHFDILNENIVFGLKGASNTYAYRGLYEDRRSSYGQGLVLGNASSHDEQNYADPWQALVRHTVTATMDGSTMIFPGQELGLGENGFGQQFGYDQYEMNFGKFVPHFKRWNSMMPLWNDLDYDNDQLYPVYAGMNRARASSPALRSSHRWFMNSDNFNDQIFAVAKYEEANASPAQKDVYLAFTNLDLNNTQADTFKIDATLADLLGLHSGRTYNVKNKAAYTAQDSGRDDAWLWGSGYTRDDLVNNGFYVSLNPLPSGQAAWAANPYEAQYLKVYDVTPPPAPAQAANSEQAGGAPKAYVVGNQVTFDWEPSPANTADDVIASYVIEVRLASDDSLLATDTATLGTSYTYTGTEGDEVYVIIKPVSAAGIVGAASSQSASVKLLSALDDEDKDGQSNEAEDAALTDPFDSRSQLAFSQVETSTGNVELRWDSVAGISYAIRSAPALSSPASWTLRETVVGTGAEMTWSDPNPVASATETFYAITVESP